MIIGLNCTEWTKLNVAPEKVMQVGILATLIFIVARPELFHHGSQVPQPVDACSTQCTRRYLDK